MLPNGIPDLETVINSNTNIVLLYVTDICITDLNTYVKIEELIKTSTHPVSLYHVCFDDHVMPFPRIQSDTLYYFAPGNQTPLFWRNGPHILPDLIDDIEAAVKMMSGVSYSDARFDETTKRKYIKSNKFLEKESLSKYSIGFKKAREFVKQTWKVKRHATVRNLPLLVSAAEASKRWDICKRCKKFDKKEERCMECGCQMTNKIHLDDATCPLKKW